MNAERNPERDNEQGDGTLAFTTSEPINAGQLVDEAARQNIGLGVATEGADTVWLAGVDEAKAMQLLQAHQPSVVEEQVAAEPRPIEEGSDEPGFHSLGDTAVKLTDNERMLLRNVCANDEPIVDVDRDKLTRLLLRTLFPTEVQS